MLLCRATYWDGTFYWEDTFWEGLVSKGKFWEGTFLGGVKGSLNTDLYSMGRKSEIEKARRLTIWVPVLAKVTLQHLKVGWPAAYWHRGWRQPRPSPLGRSGVGLLLFLLLHSLSLSSHLLPMVETSQLLLFEHLCTFTNGWSVYRRSTRKWKERSCILYATIWETIELRKLSTICFEKRKTVWGW